MGRTLFAEERLQSCMDKLYITDSFTIGLLIGQLSASQKDHAIHMVCTPLQEAAAEAGSDTEAAASGAAPVTLDSIQDFLLTTHTKQVCRMLPGGVSIIGMFVCAPADAMQAAQMKLKQLLYSVHKEVQKSRCLLHREEDDIADRYLLQICHTSRKLTCRTFDIADNKSGARPAEWKFQSSLDRWHQINATFSVDYPFHVTQADLSTSLRKQIQKGLSPLCSSLQSAVTLLNGKLRAGTEALDPTAGHHAPPGKKGKRQKAAMVMLDQANLHHTAEMFVETPCSSPSGDIEVTPCGARLLLRGAVHGRAFVHGKATVTEATRAIKEDIIQSLYSRCQLLCEDLLQTEEEQDRRVLYEMPVRVFASLPGSFVCLCDYMFQDEAAADSIDRFNELVSLHVTHDSLEQNCERIPSETELGKPACRSRHSSETQGEPRPATTQSPFQYFGAALGGLVAAVAMGLSYLYLGQE